MKAQDFRALVEQLGDLSQVQRDALVEALSAKGSGEDVVVMIETRFAASPSCGHCGEADFKPWGSASGLKRYWCKACERTFNALTGTPLAGLRLREKWLDYARSLVDGVSLRKAAERTDIHLETSFRWRHRFLAVAKDKKATAVTGIVEADETFILKSVKGSRKLVGRAPRKRGGKAKKPGLSTDEHDAPPHPPQFKFNVMFLNNIFAFRHPPHHKTYHIYFWPCPHLSGSHRTVSLICGRFRSLQAWRSFERPARLVDCR